jgi:SAM-dependent methyltransferase
MSQWLAIAENYKIERDTLSLPAILIDELVIALADAGPRGRVLDFGAGSGTLARALAASGREVTAFEPNEPMRDLMMRQTPDDLKRSITIVSDIAHVGPDAHFSTILCINVVDHLLDVADAFSLFRKKIAPDGNLILCIPHPLKNLGKWVKEWNESTSAWDYLYYRLDDYMKEGTVKRDREDVNGNLIIKDVLSQHRTIATYYNWVADAGFSVKRMYEPAPKPEHAQTFSAHYKQCSRIPYFWILDCRPL